VHKGEVHQGQHPGIVPQDLWNQAQAVLTGNRAAHHRARTTDSPHLLVGRLRDDSGSLMTPSHTRKLNGQCYRYYVSQPSPNGSSVEPGSLTRIPAASIEALVEVEIRRRLPEREGLRWDVLTPAERNGRIQAMIARVVLKSSEVEIELTEEGRATLGSAGRSAHGERGLHSPTITVRVRLKLAAGGKTIVSLDGGAPQTGRLDKALVRAVARANRWRELLESGAARSPYDLARHEGCRVSYVQRHLPLAFLAPDIVEAIIDGRQPESFTVGGLVSKGVPMSWD
jgi:site-specific DNA recombinase